MSDLKQQRCAPCEGGVAALARREAENYLRQTPGWALSPDATEINRAFTFKNFYETMAFANAVAWIANREDHHPDMELSYKRCLVRYSTHSVKGLSTNDFICAAKMNALLGD